MPASNDNGIDNGPATSSHMMKTTKRGRPYLKVRKPIVKLAKISSSKHAQDTMDLFATLVVSLRLQDNRQYFRSFPNSFTTCVARTFLLFQHCLHVYGRAVTRRRRTLLPSSSLSPTAGRTLGTLLAL